MHVYNSVLDGHDFGSVHGHLGVAMVAVDCDGHSALVRVLSRTNLRGYRFSS